MKQSLWILLVLYLGFVKANASYSNEALSDDSLTTFVELGQKVSNGVMRLRNDITREAMRMSVEEELQREMSLMKKMARAPIGGLSLGGESGSFMEVSNGASVGTKSAVKSGVKVVTGVSVKDGTKMAAKMTSKTASKNLQTVHRPRVMVPRVTPRVAVDEELSVLQRMQAKYAKTSDQAFTALLNQPVVGYAPVKDYSSDVNFLELENTLENVSDQDLENLFDFHEVSFVQAQGQAQNQAQNQAQGQQLPNHIPGLVGPNHQTPNPPGWPFSAAPEGEWSYQPPVMNEMPQSAGYVLEHRNSLAQGNSPITNNLVDSDVLYNNMNGIKAGQYPMNGGVPVDVLLQQGQRPQMPGQPMRQPLTLFNGYNGNGIVQGAFAALPNGRSMGDAGYGPPQSYPTIENQAPGSEPRAVALLDSQKTPVPYFPGQKPLPLAGNSVPAAPSVMLGHGSVQQFTPNPDQTPMSAISQDMFLHMAHTNQRMPGGAMGGAHMFSPYEQGVQATQASQGPSQRGSSPQGNMMGVPNFSFLQTKNGDEPSNEPEVTGGGGDSAAQDATPGIDPFTAPNQSGIQMPNGAPLPSSLLQPQFQENQMTQRLSLPGYFPNPNPQDVSLNYASNNNRLFNGPVPGSVPSFYPVDNMALHIPLASTQKPNVNNGPFGPYSNAAPQHLVNNIEVNPALHAVQYMADTPYFPTDSIGDNIFPPAPIEQPVQAGGPMAGFESPRTQNLGNVYIPAAPYPEAI